MLAMLFMIHDERINEQVGSKSTTANEAKDDGI